MQSKTSSFSKALFAKNLTRSWPIVAVMFLIYFLAMPVTFMLELNDWYYGDLPTDISHTMTYISRISSWMHPMIEATFAIVAILIIFNYLYNTRAANMMHAFPVSRSTLYVTGIISALVVLVIPQVIITLIMLISAAANQVTAVGYIFIWLFTRLCYDIFFVGFAGIVAMVSGQAATTAIFYGIFNFLYISMEFCVRLFASVIYVGLNNSVGEIEVNVLTPVAYLAEKVVLDYKYELDADRTSVLKFTHEFQGCSTVLLFAAAGLCFAILGYLVYKKKNMETVNDFITINLMKHVFVIGMTFFPALVCGTLWAALFLEQEAISGVAAVRAFVWIFTLLFSVIIYFVCRMLLAKSFRVFNKKNLVYLGGYCIGVVVFFGIMTMDVFGMEKALPDADSVEWAAIDSGYDALYRSPEDISTVINIHGDILKNVDELRDMQYREYDHESNGSTVRIYYKLKNGRRLVRSYYMELPDDTASGYGIVFKELESFANNPETIKKNYIAEDYETLHVDQFRYYKVEMQGDHDVYTVEEQNDFNQDQLDQLYQALLKDIDEGHMPLFTAEREAYLDDLYNGIEFEFSREEGRPSVSSIIYNYTESEQNVYLYPQITMKCTNLISAMKELGVINSEDELVTNKEVYDWEGDRTYY